MCDGIDTSEKDMVWEIRKRAGMVFQNPDNQIVQNVVEEDVGFGRRISVYRLKKSGSVSRKP